MAPLSGEGDGKAFLRGFSLGLGAAVLGFLLVPATRKALRPVLVAGLRGLMDLADQAKVSLATAREELEDIVAEAQFERLRQAGGGDGGASGREARAVAGDAAAGPAPAAGGAADAGAPVGSEP